VLLATVLAPSALCCPYSIRDSGFIVREPSPYRLLPVVKNETPGREEASRRLAGAADLYLPDAGVEAEVVNLDDPAPGKLTRRVAQDPPKRLPAAVLLSPRGRLLPLPSLSPPDLTSGAISQMVGDLASSPVRDDIARHIISHWCVVLVAEGPDAQANDALSRVLSAACKTVAGEETEMGQRVEAAPYVITLPPGQTGEAVLLASLGFDEQPSSTPRVAVLFGMLRRLGPLFAGGQVTQELLVGLFRLLGRNCTCTSDPRWLLGPAAPVRWGADLQTQVRDRLGFDANSPAVLHTLAGAWVLLWDPTADWSSPDGEGLEQLTRELPREPAGGYRELAVGAEDAEAADEGPPVIDLRAGGPPVEQRSIRILWLVAAGLLFVALAGGALILIRQRRGS